MEINQTKNTNAPSFLHPKASQRAGRYEFFLENAINSGGFAERKIKDVDTFVICDHFVNPMKDTRRRILDAALESFVQHGYQRTDVREVAEAAGLSRQGLYKYFASKEALLDAVVEALHEETMEQAEHAAKEAEARGPIAHLYALIDARYTPFIEKVYSAPYGEELLSESNRRCTQLNTAAAQRFSEMLIRAIEAEVKRGRLELRYDWLDANRLSELLLSSANGLKLRKQMPLYAADFQERLSQMVTLLCGSLVRDSK